MGTGASRQRPMGYTHVPATETWPEMDCSVLNAKSTDQLLDDPAMWHVATTYLKTLDS